MIGVGMALNPVFVLVLYVVSHHSSHSRRRESVAPHLVFIKSVRTGVDTGAHERHIKGEFFSGVADASFQADVFSFFRKRNPIIEGIISSRA